MIKLPLVGAAYKMQAQSMSCQNCINWYPQAIEYPNGQRVSALMPTPGLKMLFQGNVASARCLYVLSNGALLAVIGNKLYHSKSNKLDLTEIGSISALGTVRIADNGQIALIVNGTYTYSLDLKSLDLKRLSGSTIPRSTHVLFLDGRFVVNKAKTGQFYWSDLYSTTVNALSYSTAESTPDNITAIVTFNRELWLFGAQSVERYYGTGSSNSPFSRLSGGAMAFGCVAPDSIVSLSTGVIWLGVSEFGSNQIVMSSGGIPERISTHALEEEIASFSKTSDASAYAYQMEGHVFYVISFPSANVTFCFDVSTGLWHQRSFANVQGLHERHRSQHHAYFNNMHIVGDYRNGKLYQLDNNIFTDDGELILRERTAQAVITDQKLTRFNQLQIICETGFFGNFEKEEIKPPMISCVGANNVCELPNDPDSLASGLINTVILNGVNYPLDEKTGDFNLPENTILINYSRRQKPDEGGFFHWGYYIEVLNISNIDMRVELNGYQEYVDEYWDGSLNKNPTLLIDNENKKVTFCLSPEAKEDTCLAEHITPVVLKNIDYNYDDSDVLCISWKITDLDTNSVINSFGIEVPLTELRDSEYQHVPNVYALKVPNNISSKYYSLSRFLNNIARYFNYSIGIDVSSVEINQDLTVKQTFLGVHPSANLVYGTVNTISLKEMDISTGEILNNLGGVFSFTPSNYEDALSQIYGHYETILESAGYTVTYYDVFSYFMPNRGFQLAKTTSKNIAFSTDNTATDGVNVTWDCGWSDWDATLGYFVETDCIGPLKTEEQLKDDFYLTLSPFDGADYVPDSPSGLQKRSTRIEFMSYVEAEKQLPANGVDWIDRNNNGQKIVIDTCYFILPEPS